MSAACCAVTREAFVLSKARNMRNWLKPWTSPELESQWDESKVVGLILTGLIPLWSAGRLGDAVDTLMAKLVNPPPEIRPKVERYLTCFCEALMP